MVDEVRNFLFALNRRGQDLTSINIQRGRDHGLPDLNTVRASIGLPSKNIRILKSLLFYRHICHKIYLNIACRISIECHIFAGYQSFENITQDKEVISKLEQLYHDINNVDLWVGGLAEEHQKGELGPTFRK